MVNTLFTGKVMFVNQPIVMLGLGCRYLAESGAEWLKMILFSISQCGIYILENKKLSIIKGKLFHIEKIRLLLL